MTTLSNPPEAVFDLRHCKEEARRLLPLQHPVRILFEQEPDVLSGPCVAEHLFMLVRVMLIHHELEER